MHRRAALLALPGLLAAAGPAGAAEAPKAPGLGAEARRHPRIARAIRDLEDAIRYMEAAPHDFGGHRAAALSASRAAIAELRQALAYRGEQLPQRKP